MIFAGYSHSAIFRKLPTDGRRTFLDLTANVADEEPSLRP